MELAGKKIAFDQDLSDDQLKDLHEHYTKLWNTLKQFEFKDDKRQLQVLYEEADNTHTYESGYFVLQIRHFGDQYRFDEYNITVNNRSVFNDSPDEYVIQLSNYKDWDEVTADAVKHATKWVQDMNKEAQKEKKEPKREVTD
ncbi:hypothetical protein [Schleiferilactobacillus shenzhenensis]|uniref:Uncharacterized protein n=1 Tax=Schleiferilactobacillus shenzhenensis LY-73 TaxID=1231336 RepID=U4TSU0_9LACO|nr:hypothetical protein [Schleiferilactobacillus shenzhenensis]ERL64938.1 hypothetical protein L248_0542 [Schleiferilactobacillus shenzhenensis LY-73]